MPIATLIAAETLKNGMISDCQDHLREAGLEPVDSAWIDAGKAVDVHFDGDLAAARAALRPLEAKLDIAVQSGAHRRRMLLVSDMDSTMITVECIDELADYAGIKPEIAAITEQAMAGELDFAKALTARVALLAGLDENVIGQCLAERVRPMPGAKELVRTMAGWGAHSILVSGGFTAFTGPVAAEIGLAEVHANQLEIESGRLSGRLLGPIVDAAAKRAVLEQAAQRSDPASVLAVGDGANDIPMIAAAVGQGGLGAGFHPRPALAEAANFAVRHTDLTALLYAQGVPRAEWAVA